MTILLFILSVLMIMAIGYLLTVNYNVERELKELQDNFQLKLLSKHIALTREIESLTKIKDKQLDFTELDSIINNLRKLNG